MNDFPSDAPRAPVSSEYIVVEVPGREGQPVDVLIDDYPSGRIGELIQVSRNEWEISVDLPGSPTLIRDVKNTTHLNPMRVVFPAL